MNLFEGGRNYLTTCTRTTDVKWGSSSYSNNITLEGGANVRDEIDAEGDT